MKKIILLVLIVFILPLFACNSAETESDIVAEYGVMFDLPYFGEGEYKVEDVNGNSVDVSSNAFIPKDERGYVLTFTGSDATIKMNIKVVDTNAPKISTEYNFKYVLVGDNLILPEINAFDLKDGKVNYSCNVLFNGQKIALTNNSFTVDSTGIYTLQITAADKAGNVAEKSVYFESQSDVDGLTEVVASFSTPYGVEHIGNSKGFNPTYSTDKKYGNETGSLQLEMNGDQWFAPSMILKNCAKTDLSDSLGFVFRIFNDMGENISFAINWVEESFVYSLPTDEWTEIYVSKEHFGDFANTTPEIFRDKFNVTDITGMYFAFFAQDASGQQKGLPRGKIYFSDICEIKNVSVQQLADVIDGFGESLTENDELSVENVIKVYNQFSEVGKRILKDRYNGLITKYGDYLIDKYGSVKEENTLIYFDSEAGLKQTTFGMVKCSVQDNPFDIGKALKMVTVDGSGGKFVQFDMLLNPLHDDYAKIVFDIYVVDTQGYDIRLDYVNDKTGTLVRGITLNNGKNSVEIPINNTSIVGGFIQIYAFNGYDSNGNDAWIAFPDGLVFYLTSIKGEN